MEKTPCRHCKRETATEMHHAGRGDVPVCVKCGACKCEDCVAQGWAYLGNHN